MNQEQVEKAILWNSLTNLGPAAKLKWTFDPYNTEKVLKENYNDYWIPYNQKKDDVNNRWGLPITSPTGDVSDNSHLNSFSYMMKVHGIAMDEKDCINPTPVYWDLPDIKHIVDQFYPNIGRVHFLRADKGGFWPPHRDFHTPSPDYFRLSCVFGRAKPENYVLMLDGKPFYMDPGYMYFVNFQMDHSVFSFSNDVHLMVLTVENTEKNVNTILENTMAE